MMHGDGKKQIIRDETAWDDHQTTAPGHTFVKSRPDICLDMDDWLGLTDGNVLPYVGRRKPEDGTVS